MKDKVCVVGLGFIGLPLSVAFASKGINVIGYDINESNVKKINQGESHIFEPGLAKELEKVVKNKKFKASTDPSVIGKCKFILISVGTPVDEQGEPILDYVKSACVTIGKNMKKSSIVVLKSTVPPLTTEGLVVPLLEESSGMFAGKDFGVAFCPERTVEGQALREFKTLPKVVGGIDKKTTDKVAQLFSVLNKNVVKVSKPRTAEMVKLMDNTYRDTNIALANEFAMACNTLGIDAIEAIQAANKNYSRNHIHIPGAGVGGSCLTKDPLILANTVSKRGKELRLIRVAREINASMPYEVITLIKKLLGDQIGGEKITLLGLAFKKDTNDLRETPAEIIYDELRNEGADVNAYDKFVFKDEVQKFIGVPLENDLYSACEGSDCVVIVTDHSEFKNIDLKKLKKVMANPCIVDGRHMIDPEKAIKLGFKYEGIGRPSGYWE